MNDHAEWWRKAVFYQIYPRSFMDSDGDGVGDLAGIVSRLDYLVELGVDALWISPFFKSPMRDFGYDVSDYREVDPLFGTKEDCLALLDQAHRRGIRVLFDLVANHSSDEHPWFVEARASRDNPRHHWYLWQPIRRRALGGRPIPPNNWRSLFELRSAWYENPQTDELYLATFTRFQPEFNWRNPAVAEAFAEILRYWFGLGVDGFRLDVATAYFKDELLRSNPPGLVIKDLFQRHLYDRNRPEVFPALAALRAVADEYPGRILVGETHGRAPELAAACHGEHGEGLQMAFNFDFLDRPWSARAFRESARTWYAALPEGAWPNFTLSNHDQPRHAWRYRSGADTEARARVAAAMLLLLRGSPFLYYGEEIGMLNARIARKQLRDPLGIATWPLKAYGRDGERTPMQWDSGANAGFTKGEPWLPLNPDYPARNAERQLADPASLLGFYRRLIALRKGSEALQSGSLRFLGEDADVLAWEREAGGERLRIALNFTGKSRPLPGGVTGTTLLGTHSPEGSTCPARLRAYEVLVLKAD